MRSRNAFAADIFLSIEELYCEAVTELMRVGRQVERWQSRDGKHLLRLFSRGTDRFYFVELSEIVENSETFWATTIISEEFTSLENAKCSAAAQVPWLTAVP